MNPKRESPPQWKVKPRSTPDSKRKLTTFNAEESPPKGATPKGATPKGVTPGKPIPKGAPAQMKGGGQIKSKNTFNFDQSNLRDHLPTIPTL